MNARWMLLLSLIAIAGGAPRLQAQQSQSVSISLSIPALEGFARHRRHAAAEPVERAAARPTRAGELKGVSDDVLLAVAPTGASSITRLPTALPTDPCSTRSCPTAEGHLVTISSVAPAADASRGETPSVLQTVVSS